MIINNNNDNDGIMIIIIQLGNFFNSSEPKASTYRIKVGST